jgi:hypothetical protein
VTVAMEGTRKRDKPRKNGELRLKSTLVLTGIQNKKDRPCPEIIGNGGCIESYGSQRTASLVEKDHV